MLAATTEYSARNRLAFVLPVVNPGSDRVRDYEAVETVLRESIRSLTAQAHDEISVVVVGHRPPTWIPEADDRVRFLDVGDHSAFAANRNHVRVDKGMKYALGCLYAIGVERADLVMLADADDFVRADLARRLFAMLPAIDEADGFLIRRGLELSIAASANRLTIKAAFEIDSFHRGCGTCRIFRAASLVQTLHRLDTTLFERATTLEAARAGHVVKPPGQLLDYLKHLTDAVRDDEGGAIRILGRHTRQAPHFRFLMLDEPLAAKTCGHGNHDSGYKGDIVHWRRIIRLADPEDVLARFGLAASPVMAIEPDEDALRRARRWIVANRAVRLGRRLLPPRRKY